MWGFLPMNESTAESMAAHLKKRHAEFMSHNKRPEARGKLGNTSDKELGCLAKVLWAPEIASAYITDEIIRLGEEFRDGICSMR
jgi:hypothetical protein